MPNQSDPIADIFARKDQEDTVLTPSLSELRYIIDYASVVLRDAHMLNSLSQLVHGDAMDKERAQGVMDRTKKTLLKNIDHLTIFLTQNDEMFDINRIQDPLKRAIALNVHESLKDLEVSIADSKQIELINQSIYFHLSSLMKSAFDDAISTQLQKNHEGDDSDVKSSI